LKNLTVDAIILLEAIAMARRETQQPKKRTTVVATTVALPLSPSAAPAQPTTEAGSPFYRPVSVEEFLEQIHRDEHKRRMFAWKLATCLNISLEEAYAILERHDNAQILKETLLEAPQLGCDEKWWQNPLKRLLKLPLKRKQRCSFWLANAAPCAERAPNFRAASWRCVGG
jgi:hypothetical protein